MLRRSGVIVLMVVATGLLAGRPAETHVSRTALDTLPLRMDDWQGRDAQPLPDDVTAQLGVDDYVNRVYVEASGAPVGVYIGYYASQRQGDTMHSPQNCLPGAGWRPIETGYQDLPTGSASSRVNRYVIQKGLDRQVVLYWYQGRGRVVANEYVNKLFLMWDAGRLNRSDGGLVRIIAPAVAGVAEASSTATRFATALMPRLMERLP